MGIISRSIVTALALMFSASIFALSQAHSPVTDNEPEKDREEIKSERLDCDAECVKQTKMLTRYARNGSPQAQTMLGLSYKTGEFTEVDHSQALKWIKRASRQKYAPAIHVLSQWCRAGYQLEQSEERANEYLKEAAEQGFPPAVYDLAVLKYQQRDFEQASALMQRAIQLGSHKARLLAKTNIPPELVIESQTGDAMASKVIASDSAENVVTVIASQAPLMDLYGDLIQDINETNLYDNRFNSIARGDLKCGQFGSPCNVMSRDTFLSTSSGLVSGRK